MFGLIDGMFHLVQFGLEVTGLYYIASRGRRVYHKLNKG